MTYRLTVIFASMVVLSVAASCPAMADVYNVTYTGTASGVDTYGLFGAAGATLSGVAYTSTYTYDPSRFGSAYQYSTSGDAYVYGGSGEQGTTDPLLSAAITVGGRTYNQSSAYEGEEQLANISPYASLVDEANSSASNYLVNYDYFLTSPIASLTVSQSILIPPGTNSIGGFYYNGESLSLHDTYFAVTDIGSLPPATVPEPGSFALLAVAAGVFAAALVACRTMAGRHEGAVDGQVMWLPDFQLDEGECTARQRIDECRTL